MQLEVAMRSALSLAKRGIGCCSPNPSVGCLILDRSNNLIGMGRTSDKGRPHAEMNALNSLTASSKGATAIVTLEPCAHKDTSPSCAELLINAGIKHVVISVLDPDIRTNGKGVKLLKKSGVKVSLGLLEEKSLDINAGFIFRLKYNRPLVSLKIASSLDGKIATANGNSKWITGELSRMHGHSLRANHDVILVGINTVLKDDPKLNCRIRGLEKYSPVRVIVDSSLSIPLTSNVLNNLDKIPTIIWTKHNINSPKKKKLIDMGVEIIELEKIDNKLNLIEGLTYLSEKGYNKVLVEGGSEISASLMANNLIDKVFLYRSGIFIGGDGLSGIASYNINNLDLIKRYKLLKTRVLDDDVLEEWSLVS
ncbi:bifunctional diaminohydroxyphosphoribosylaminopyrimidine deaminase/5-amino-6-(5-phosphoribosylamino)uracil reductase RibD [Alphaproteobacteria bacterium]|jgi:diaminohydroxyphosphoribosylaminopyrimidine deaminase/5-amino-6-(5-phosphoribosylamino)uracil reductase|nr:bifunctional diaminohydroxyphosphoribosylaminopyrimidine deaminase/5-amino-6-(5-phosphoribosylamino)uracil reductase RibD [Alphaproteobacteria bacterium]